VVTTPAAEHALARSRTGSPRPVIVLDGADGVDAGADLELACASEDPAYVIYTSGSTGEPKGVVVPQRAVLRLVCDTDYVQLAAGDVIAHLSNPAFDATTFEIWGALLNGACLAVIPREAVLAPTELAAALDRHGVTTLFLTTALFNLVARDAPQAFTGRTVLFGGEAVDPRRVAAALSDGHPGRLLHVYGPTEATTFATWHEVRAVDPDAPSVPIGRPIANTEVYVLDRNGEPVPCGIPGEIHIGGPGLATGYLGRGDLTAERFVGHPFAREPGARLYRTGDRARYRSDGAIEFLGRIDRQVKIRGYRVEPGELEVALRALPQVRDAVVVVHGDTAETRRLSAYVVQAPGRTPTPAELWSDLRGTLPEYMLPAGIVLLDAMPLTPNGKLDLRALPDPVDLAEQRTGFHMPPQNPLQQMIATIWEELLGLRNVGVRDSFFEIGGHSLLAAQMMDAVENACGVQVPLTMLFTHPTIADLAAAIRSRPLSPEPVTALNTGGSRPPLFFLHGDFSGAGFYCIPLARALGDEQPFYAVHPHGLDGRHVPESIEAMATERLRVLRSMRPTGPYFLGGHCNGAFVALEIARQLVQQGEEVPMVVLLDAKAPRQGPRGSAASTTDRVSPASQRGAGRGSIGPARGKRDVFARYRAAVESYAPAPYPGRVVVLRSENTRDRRADLGWSVLGAGVETYTIPGDHHSSITRHVAETAARMKACIEAGLR
jgi:amino acid adenylation domain-containing protein